MWFRAAPIPINVKMYHVAIQLIFKIIDVQKFSILARPKFKAFLKKYFQMELCLFLGGILV